MDLIRSKVAEMAGLSERALKASLRALVERNRQLAYSVILRDQYIDELETELNRLCLEFLVRQQPVAGHLRFVFSSAGMTPQPVDARAVTFMAQKGIDLSRQASKSLEQVPQWEHYQVVIALSAEAREALPIRAKKTICLTWSVQDPAQVEDLPDAGPAAFESAFQSLESHIRDLVGAILEQPQTESKP